MDDITLVSIHDVKFRRPELRVNGLPNSSIKAKQVNLFPVKFKLRSSMLLIDKGANLTVLRILKHNA